MIRKPRGPGRSPFSVLLAWCLPTADGPTRAPAAHRRTSAMHRTPPPPPSNAVFCG